MASSYSNIHPVDQILTSLAVEAIPSDSQLIADQVFEKVPQRPMSAHGIEMWERYLEDPKGFKF